MNKTILITGSTDGIGKIAALKLAQEGHHVYLHGRNPQKLADTISEIKSLSNNENIKGFTADFSDLDQVRSMASEVKQELTKIDILINNAGIFKSNTPGNKDGIDIRLVVNYLAPYLLTQELIPLIDNSESARILNLSSAAQAPVSLEALNKQKSLSMQEAYAQSKLALTMWSFWLAQKQQKISVIAVNPGSLLNTKMVMETYGHHWAPADKGANILYELAISAAYEGISQKYFDNDKGDFNTAHPNAYESKKIDELIAATDLILSK